MLSWLDYLIILIPLCFVFAMALRSRRYVKGVANYLAAGRVAGRYVIAVGDIQAGLSVITLVALVEVKYQTGYALGFWENIVAPVGIVIALTGYCTYRWRETRALSMGQFLEMRYNKVLRIVCASLRTLSEMITNAIGPAIAANFFIYFLGLPRCVQIFGIPVPCFFILLTVLLAAAVLIIWPGGRIALIITDSIQGLISFPIFVLLTGYVLCSFNWDAEIAPVMLDRVKGQSFLNPFDIEELRDFNIFALVVTITGSILNRASWLGNDSSNAGRNAHEQKMAGLLGALRGSIAPLMCMLLAVMVITVMNHENYAEKAHVVRQDLAGKVADELFTGSENAKVKEAIAQLPVQKHVIGKDAPLSGKQNLETLYFSTVRDTLGNDGRGNFLFQRFRSVYHQMMLPVVMRNILPVGLTGILCLLMIMLLVSTDDSRIFNASSTIIQDIVVPFVKTPLTPEKHVFWLKLSSLGVGVFFLISSLFFVHLDYINMFITIMTSLWLGGAGPIMIFGLYSRFGNTTGAFCSLIFGSGFSITGFLLQRNWAGHVYPFLLNHGVVDKLDNFLRTVSSPFNPWIRWEMNPVKFPINSLEIYFLAMIIGIIAYVTGSLLTWKGPFNLDKMLHRGEYADPDSISLQSPWTWKNIFNKLIGITPEYTTGDKVIAWCVFGYAFVYNIVLCFFGVLLWNLISPWPKHWWSHYFFYTALVGGAIVGVISSIWFFWGGVIDLRRLFRDLEESTNDPLDDGRVLKDNQIQHNSTNKMEEK